MNIREYRSFFLEKLSAVYDAAEAESLFYICLENLKRWKKIDLAMNSNAELTRIELIKWNEVLTELEEQRPIQYIFENAHFYGLEFFVNESTLIPRPETEELVEWIINENKDKKNIKILDIGTGSGCIAITLAKNLPNAKVFAIDVSKDALATAKRNAIRNTAEVTFIEKDILTTESLLESFDVIVSNPPYVRNLEKHEIKKNVLAFEPHLALFVDDSDPLLFYRKIGQLAKASLPKEGKLYFEINQYLGPETVTMLEENFYDDVVLKKDIYGNDRMVAATIK
ncbi:peptide chain release factor N(5)-glutamine methyltransferase [Flavobacterium alkalisoli]|uniref:peptide chain release factor N(5)-glutamine methyltransferase n=1 Tax=Flavobacterium alkalisoli TaxID=2602769 RepID=UPI003A8EAAE6